MIKHHPISFIYMVLLGIGLLLGVVAIFVIPVDTYSSHDSNKTVLEPYSVTQIDDDTRIYQFRGVKWDQDGTCLNFVSSHQRVTVWADQEIIFERKGVQTIFGRTSGFAWEYIEIPTDTKRVTVTISAIYPEVRNSNMVFYQGFSTMLFRDIIRDEGFTAIMSVLTLCLGILMAVYGFVSYRQSPLSRSMFYLGVFSMLLSTWSCTENGIVAILMENRAASSYISYVSLAFLGLSFILFIRSYLHTEEKWLYGTLVVLNIGNILVVFFLQLCQIADMKQTLTSTHVVLVLSLLYLPYAIIVTVRQRGMTERNIVAICSLCAIFPPLILSLFQYYSGEHNVADYGDLFFFIFIAIYAIHVSISLRKDINTGREAALYRELAEKDLLTGCYNRNAYRNDSSECTDLSDTLLVACDLNNLKRCNDTLGHAYGDKYLVDSANILKEVFSAYGKVYRIGGDEFCIVIPNRKQCHIHTLIATLLERELIYNADAELIKLEIACGYAEYDPAIDTKMDDILNRADALMYENKKELKKAAGE